MKVAFLVIAHKELHVLKQLLNSLNHPDVDIIIHLDRKSEIDIDTLSFCLDKNENLYYIDDRISVNWGGSGLLDVQISLMRTAIKIKKYDYLSFLSGQDLLIKPIQVVLDYLERNYGCEFVEYFKLPDYEKWSGNGGSDRLNYFWLVDQFGLQEAAKLVQLQNGSDKFSSFPDSMIPYGGSNWMTITQGCAEYVVSFLEKHESYRNFFDLTLLPEEICLQTLILNSAYKPQTINKNLRYIDWKSPGTVPKILDITDYEHLANSECHFARKFDSLIDSEIMELIKSFSYK